MCFTFVYKKKSEAMARIKCYLHVSVSSLYVEGLTKKNFQVRSPMNLDETQAPGVINMYFSHKNINPISWGLIIHYCMLYY